MRFRPLKRYLASAITAALLAAGAGVAATPPAPAESLKLRQTVQPGTTRVEEELDLSAKSDTAFVEGIAPRGVPHRYILVGKKGQSLSATLRSNDGARFDLYAPGSLSRLLSSDFVAQGARVGGSSEGTPLHVELPTDGKYLLLVRAQAEASFYTLELGVQRGAPSVMERLASWESIWIGAFVSCAALAAVIFVRRKRNRRIFR